MHMADWRSAANYSRHQNYDRAAFAWEIVRRNDAYGRDYERTAQAASESEAETERFANRWGLRFGADPKLDIDQQPVFWLPRVLPTALHVRPAGAELAFEPLDFSRFMVDPNARFARLGDDVLLSRRGVRHQIWLDQYQAGALAVVLPLDRLFESRLAAARRLWRELRGLSPGPDPMALSPYARGQLVLVMRLLDAEHSGASERDMASVVLGAVAMSRRDWIGSDGRSRLRRLLRRGHTLLDGGYLRLLNPPPKRR
jgi:hypothetical protein